MNTRLLLASLCLLPAAAAEAAAEVRDLGQGLAYYRLHELPADLPRQAQGSPGARVLDLRFAKGDETGAAALRAWIAFNASAKAPLFVIENASTSAALKSSLSGNATAGLVLLAPDSAKLDVDVPVQVSAAADRMAYEALEKGVAPASLLADNPDKPRIDEAYLEKEHIPDSQSPEVPSDSTLPPRPLVDRLLQRAVQLHRGLLALGRI